MQLMLTRILGWLVIAHGLSHAVLPMRGSLGVMQWRDDGMPVALYGVSMIGFVAAGLGMLGRRPFDRAISPLLVVASGWSFVAILVLEDPGLRVGAVCDVALLLVGLWRAFAGWPAHPSSAEATEGRPSHRRIWHGAAVALAFLFVSYVGVAAFSYPFHSTWGSTAAELEMPLPGDAESRDPALEATHAITIEAPAEDVWVWLVQLGQDRAGFYSYDWLERAVGLGIHNVREVRPEWQTLQAGDVIRATPANYLGGVLGEVAWTVSDLTPQRALVLEGRGSFVLQPVSDERTRLIIRSTMGDRQHAVWSSAASLFGYQLPHFIMQRRMMLTIKALAEERYAMRAADTPARTIEIVGTDDMKYSVTRIDATPGEKLRIRLVSKGVLPKMAMAHNVVVVKLETDIELMLKEGAPYRENDFIPPSMQQLVIAKAHFAGAGERVQVTFTVPDTPGDYPFLCTFAGHYQAGMKGTLIVKADTKRHTDASLGRTLEHRQ
jgi:azurin